MLPEMGRIMQSMTLWNYCIKRHTTAIKVFRMCERYKDICVDKRRDNFPLWEHFGQGNKREV